MVANLNDIITRFGNLKGVDPWIKGRIRYGDIRVNTNGDTGNPKVAAMIGNPGSFEFIIFLRPFAKVRNFGGIATVL